MTGVRGERDEKYEDSPSQFYQNKVNSASKYGVVQVGLTCFIPNHTTVSKVYHAQSYTFWISPFITSDDPNHFAEVTFEDSAIKFLNKESDPDWNKYLKEGIPFVSKNLWMTLQDKMNIAVNERCTEKLLEAEPLSEDDQKILDIFIEKMNFVIKENTHKVDKEFTYELASRQSTVPYNVQRHLVNHCKIHYWNSVYLRIKENDKEYAVENHTNINFVIYENRNLFQDSVAQVKDKIMHKYYDQVGFTMLFQELLSSKKVLVGHGCYSDLLFLFQNFDQPLPSELIEFKQLINSTYVNVYDTRVIQEDDCFEGMFLESKKLEDLYNKINDLGEDFKSPEIKITYEMDSTFHNAGYDSYVTGYAFLKMKYWCSGRNLNTFVKLFKNMIYMHRSLYVLNLSSNEDQLAFAEPERLYYVKVTDLKENKKKTTMNDVRRHLRLEDAFDVKWNGEDDFFVYLSKKDIMKFEDNSPIKINPSDLKWIVKSYDKWEVSFKSKK